MLLDIKRLRQTKDMNLRQSKGIGIFGNCEQQGRYKTQKKIQILESHLQGCNHVLTFHCKLKDSSHIVT
jgi:hypothetical protein